jgi:hypothetical protein
MDFQAADVSILLLLIFEVACVENQHTKNARAFW